MSQIRMMFDKDFAYKSRLFHRAFVPFLYKTNYLEHN